MNFTMQPKLYVAMHHNIGNKHILVYWDLMTFHNKSAAWDSKQPSISITRPDDNSSQHVIWLLINCTNKLLQESGHSGKIPVKYVWQH